MVWILRLDRAVRGQIDQQDAGAYAGKRVSSGLLRWVPFGCQFRHTRLFGINQLSGQSAIEDDRLNAVNRV